MGGRSASLATLANRQYSNPMLLTLEVISANGDALGSNRRKTVGPEGARIGRARDSDWVINDQYISRTHAHIRYVSGAFYIEGMGRNPLALNDPGQTIPNNEPQLLRNGDRFFLDEYEIRVTMPTGGAAHVTSPTREPRIIDDPFAPEGSARTPSSAGQPWDIGIVDAAVDEGASLDPLAALGGSLSRKEAPLAPVNIHQGSVLEDNYQPPLPTTQPARNDTKGDKSSNKIPDAWDRSGFTQIGQQPQPAAPPKKPAPPIKPGNSAQPPRPGDSSIPETWDKSRLTQLGQASAAGNAPLKPQPAVVDPTSVLPPRTPPFQETAPNARVQPPPRTLRRPIDPVAAPPPVKQPVEQFVEQSVERPVEQRPAEPRRAPPAAAAGSLDLEELLRAAGLSAAQMSPELASELGQVLRIVVQGVMEVLQSRAEIKSQLRMSMTRMQATENNPLKFSPNVEAALHTLLVERNRGYLPTTRAFQEALTDIRNHQIAVLQGIRSAFDSMLEHFDPERLEEEFERGSKRGGLLNLGAKSRFRDHYVEQFASMTKDPDESFRRLFGEYFAQAYEAQMDRLKATGRTAGGQ